jgi:hypothetical protein
LEKTRQEKGPLGEDRIRQEIEGSVGKGRQTKRKETCIIVFNGLFACPLSLIVSLAFSDTVFCCPEKRPMLAEDSIKKRSLDIRRQEKGPLDGDSQEERPL